MINFGPAMKARAPDIRILTIRNQKVVLDSDLAAVYGVTTKRLNEQVRRNKKRFPESFAFQLTAEEFSILRSQFAIRQEFIRSTPTKGFFRMRV
jgi:hypothetical protein